jgi:hypothetical protein
MRRIPITAGITLFALLGVLPAQAARANTALVAGAARAVAVTPGQASVAVLDVVMLVDESGSETQQKVAQEKATASTIVQSMLSPLSRVTVIGFGGVNHVVPNQNPVSVVCQPTIASGAQNLSYLATCVNGLHRRSEAEGDDTDYAAALEEAMNYLAPSSTATPPSPSGAIKVILMMTDGAVDVRRDTQQYGKDWQLGEQTAINQQLAFARQYSVQVWPLGFGTDIGTGITQPESLAYLNNIAAHGAPAVCDTRHTANQPHATWVNDVSDTYGALNQLYGDAACVGENTKRTIVPPGQSRTLTVTIPAIASDAAISVRRGSSDVSVAFTRPDGTQWTDASAISGTDNASSVEVLHLSDITTADVGAWQIKLTAPPGQASQLVSATAFWQGAVRAIITATPQVNPGKQVRVTLSVLGPNGPVTDPSTLQNLVVGVTATGDGLTSPEQVPVSAEGGLNGAGSYTGTLTAPRQAGPLTITGAAAGYGLYVTQTPATVTVGASTAFAAVPEFPLVTSVRAGDSLTGQILFTNSTGVPVQVRLVLTASGTNAGLVSPVGPVTVPSGKPSRVPFTIAVNKDSPIGPAVLIVQTVNAASGQPYDSARLALTVTKPPGFLAKYLWVIIGALIAVLLLIAFLLWRRARRRAAINVQDLTATLRRGGEQKGRDLPAESKWSDVFQFVVNGEETEDPHLAYPPRGWSGPVYQVRRARQVKLARSGKITLLSPTRPGKPYEIEADGSGVQLDNGLELSFRDKHRRHAIPRVQHDAWGDTASRAAATNDPDGTHTVPSVPPPADNDPWL